MNKMEVFTLLLRDYFILLVILLSVRSTKLTNCMQLFVPYSNRMSDYTIKNLSPLQAVATKIQAEHVRNKLFVCISTNNTPNYEF